VRFPRYCANSLRRPAGSLHFLLPGQRMPSQSLEPNRYPAHHATRRHVRIAPRANFRAAQLYS
jgi:hypothetical protein